ncbi:hypothetical protein CAPTEDRAFT_108145 [Capitella teleta]|uniref:Ubiquitin-like protease family profile domain-containing protein n=1 Tax=Capitella teleta TaxID=283909 RepID=R7VBF7_CAPTE|nr:hypothetical protein CAPTEDRAFT_108145 [Capitella teleta]|eukprot:ELU15887.1 hypothetical protein CAPTEDRAFT_108145 [Capitella teleta]
MASEGKVILSFHDSLLRESDVKTLDSGQWLNDQIIGFAFQYFENEVFSEYSNQVAFLSPEVTQMIKFISSQEASMLLSALELSSKQLIFFAVNDSDSATASGGSHWSTVCFNRTLQRFEHYDSLGGNNNYAAKTIVSKIAPVVQCELELLSVILCNQFRFIYSGCDCGVYVITLVELISNKILKSKKCDVMDSTEIVKTKRKEFKDTIFQLAKKS